MFRRESPVAVFMVLVLLGLAALLSAGLGLIEHEEERAQLEADLHATAQVQADQLAASLGLAVWNFDQSQVTKIAASEMRNREVQEVLIRVRDRSAPGGERVFGLARGPDGAEHPVTAAGPAGADLEEERPLMEDGQEIGTVRVLYTPAYLEQELRTRLLRQVATFVAFGTVMAAVFYWLLWRTVLRPLLAIEQYAGEVSSGRPAPPARGIFRGELDRLRRSIEKMVELLAARYEVLRASERQFRTFIEEASVPILLVPSPDGAPLYFNPAFTRVFGYTREDIRSPEDWWPMVYPEEQYRAERHALWADYVAKLKETGGFRDTGEAQMRTRSGEVRYAQIRISIVGEYRMSFINDLTERRAAEKELRATQYAVDHNPTMIFRIDLEGRFIYANDAACGRLGVTPAEISRMHVWDFSIATTEANWAERSGHFRAERDAMFESTYRKRGGEQFPAEVRIQYVEFSGDRFFIVFAFDITQRRAAQEAQLAYTRRIQALATELTRSEERQRRELAAVLHDGVGQNLFAATTQLLALRQRNGNAQAELDKTVAILDQVTRETRDLTFSLCPPVLYQLGLVPALQRLAEQFTERYGVGCSIAGTTRGPEDLNLRGLAYQTVRELLNNVAKHARARQVTIGAEEIDGDVRLEVADDGVGFDTGRLKAGTGGFGLFHLQERIELLGGSFRLEAYPGKGSRVQFRLPLKMNVPQTTG